MYVCMCIYICMYVGMYVYLGVHHTGECIHAYMYAHVDIKMHASFVAHLVAVSVTWASVKPLHACMHMYISKCTQAFAAHLVAVSVAWAFDQPFDPELRRAVLEDMKSQLAEAVCMNICLYGHAYRW